MRFFFYLFLLEGNEGWLFLLEGSEGLHFFWCKRSGGKKTFAYSANAYIPRYLMYLYHNAVVPPLDGGKAIISYFRGILSILRYGNSPQTENGSCGYAYECIYFGLY